MIHATPLMHVLMTLTAVRPSEDWRPWFDELVRDRRAVGSHGPAGILWCAEHDHVPTVGHEGSIGNNAVSRYESWLHASSREHICIE